MKVHLLGNIQILERDNVLDIQLTPLSMTELLTLRCAPDARSDHRPRTAVIPGYDSCKTPSR